MGGNYLSLNVGILFYTVTTLVDRPDIGRQRRMSILGLGPELDTDL